MCGGHFACLLNYKHWDLNTYDVSHNEEQSTAFGKGNRLVSCKSPPSTRRTVHQFMAKNRVWWAMYMPFTFGLLLRTWGGMSCFSGEGNPWYALGEVVTTTLLRWAFDSYDSPWRATECRDNIISRLWLAKKFLMQVYCWFFQERRLNWRFCTSSAT